MATTATATKSTEATAKRAPRRTPQLVDTFEGEIPSSQRDGFWVNAVRDIMAKPGEVFVYRNVSPTTASTLRKNHGLDAHTRTEGDEKVLYVKYDAQRVDEIKAAVAQRGAKRKANANGNKQAAK
jgi:hypothetical protein